jgi:hypothetical protein
MRKARAPVQREQRDPALPGIPPVDLAAGGETNSGIISRA